MGAHFQAFSFVDRLMPRHGKSTVRGSYAIPPGLEAFPISLVGEAIGQMTAWHAMAELNFACRPVAGITGSVGFHGQPLPGQLLELEAQIEQVDDESVNYSGYATAEGKRVLTLTDCLGPMLPMEEFDSVEAMRERYKLLLDAGARPHAFGGVPCFRAEVSTCEPGREMEWSFRVPVEAMFFEDHFPRKPLFPGTLLTGMFVDLATDMANGSEVEPGGEWHAGGISNLKLRSFIAPGDELQLRARVEEHEGEEMTVLLETRRGSKKVIAGGKVLMTRKGTNT